MGKINVVCIWIFFFIFVNLDVDPVPSRKTSSKGVERMLEFGRELFQLGQRLEKENEANETNQKMLEVTIVLHLYFSHGSFNKFNFLQDAFSLLAYSNPWSSPLGWQLCPSRRETVCAALNSAILGNLIFLIFNIFRND